MVSVGNGTNRNIFVTEVIPVTNVTHQLTNGTTGHTNHATEGMYYFSLCFITLPGFITNVLALCFIIKDIKNAVFPAIVLLLALVCSDLAAVTFITVYHSILQYVTDVTYSLCAVLSVLNTFFRLYSGILNVLMCTDRVLAICAPYFYKQNIRVPTWKRGIIVSAACTFLLAILPVIGLGDVVKTTFENGRPTLKCTTLFHRTEIHKKISSILYGIIGLMVSIYILVGNCMVIRSVFRMRKKMVSVNPEPSNTATPGPNIQNPKLEPFEIAFAKLMGCLAVVCLVSGVPYSILIICEQISPVNGIVTGMIHFLAGLSYSVDPIVYTLIRKAARRRILIFLRCKCGKNDRN